MNFNRTQQRFVDRLNLAMANNYHDYDFSVMALSEQIAVVDRQLRRKIKNLYNLSPSQYIRLYRLKKATELLIEGEQLLMASENAGFASYSVFYGAIKKHYGLSPSQYKEQVCGSLPKAVSFTIS